MTNSGKLFNPIKRIFPPKGLTINSQPDRESEQNCVNEYDLTGNTFWSFFFFLEGFLLFFKSPLHVDWLWLPVNVWLCRQIRTWRHCSVIHSVTGVNLRETGVRGTNGSHVGRGSLLMPWGLLCEKRQEGKRRDEYWWCQLPCAGTETESSRWSTKTGHGYDIQFIYLLSKELEDPISKFCAVLASF